MDTRRNRTAAEWILYRVIAARVLLLLFFHIIVFAAAYALAFLLRFDFAIRPEFTPVFKASLPVVVGLQLVVGFFFSFYKGWWRYVGVTDVVRLTGGMMTSLVLLLVLWYAGPSMGIDQRLTRPPRGVLLIDFAFALLFLFSTRLLIRMGRDRFRSATGVPELQKRVLVIGAGDAGEALVREIQHRPQMGLKVVGFVDDQRVKWGSSIRGIDVQGPIARVGEITDTLRADEALIAIPSASGKRMREIIHQLSAANLPLKTIPGIDQLVTGKVQVSQLRPVNMEDLLRRARIDLPGDPVRELFKGRRVLVTGAGGTIGSELASQILQFEPERLALVERSEYALYESRRRLGHERITAGSTITANVVDICDKDIVEELIARERPQIVLHAAAHKHVPLGEDNPPEYLRNNTLATLDLAELCSQAGVERFVFISTDKAINPSSLMGATKRAAEILLLDHARRTSMKVTAVRFGNVIGSSGSVIPLFMEQIAAGQPLTVTHPDVTRYFIRTSEAISLVLQAATLANDGHIFMLDMGEPIRIADLARDLIRLSNHTEEEIPVVFTGLRPGEKLFEEIRLEGESIAPTVHPQIVVTRPPQPGERTVGAWIAQARYIRTAEEAVGALRRLIPEYTTPGVQNAAEAVPVSPSAPVLEQAQVTI
ncbi:MAG: polysaccharide biosynthesis protein [Thermoanaerobaculia bacterium]